MLYEVITPYLTAYLRSKGWQAAQRDFNIASYERFLSPGRLKKVVEKMQGRLEAVRSKSSFTIKDKSLIDVLATGIKFSGAILSQVEEAKAVMRTPRITSYNVCYTKLLRDFTQIPPELPIISELQVFMVNRERQLFNRYLA